MAIEKSLSIDGLAKEAAGIPARVSSGLADRLVSAALSAPMPETMTRLLEAVQPSQMSRQRRLRRYQGSVAIVGSLPESAARSRRAAATAAKILCSNEVIMPGRIVGLRAMLPATALYEEGIDEPDWLNKAAAIFKRAIAKECEVVTLVNPSPIRVEPGVTFHHPEAAYDALAGGITDLETRAKEISPPGTYTQPSLIAVADANYAATIFPVLERELEKGQVMGLARVGQIARHNLWTPLDVIPGRKEQRAQEILQANLGA